jgi:hypothetical protein
MFKFFVVTAVVLSMGCVSKAPCKNAEKKVLLEENFNRADSDVIGNSWKVTVGDSGVAKLDKESVLFEPEDEDFTPRIEHTFAVQTSGKFTVSFKMDWVREYETNWAFYMQLGDSKKIPAKMDYESDAGEGISVNLVWGGGEAIDSEEVAVFGSVKAGKVTKLAIVNDDEDEKSIVVDPVVTIVVDMDKSTYDVSINGKTYANQAFDNKGSIDTIRFIADKTNMSNFVKASVDDVKIVK